MADLLERLRDDSWRNHPHSLARAELEVWDDACRKAADRIEDLQATIDQLPKCWRLNEVGELVQDVPVTPGMVVSVWYEGRLFTNWVRWVESGFITIHLLGPGIDLHRSFFPRKVFSTREAAKANEKARSTDG